MNVLILATVSTMLTGNFFFEVPEGYEDIYEQAVNNCHNRSPEQVDLNIVRKLVHIENDFFSVEPISFLRSCICLKNLSSRIVSSDAALYLTDISFR